MASPHRQAEGFGAVLVRLLHGMGDTPAFPERRPTFRAFGRSYCTLLSCQARSLVSAGVIGGRDGDYGTVFRAMTKKESSSRSQDFAGRDERPERDGGQNPGPSRVCERVAEF